MILIAVAAGWFADIANARRQAAIVPSRPIYLGHAGPWIPNVNQFDEYSELITSAPIAIGCSGLGVIWLVRRRARRYRFHPARVVLAAWQK